ncbi:hypothetical protein J2Z21_006456 [Streptomyces griseochromogenes]|uniref:Uncharacterized protein n=1 Tax=Streptomyces griseochromogenes TaxID=68214 RepID=A0A1B1B9Y1_9ACTN|nr:hypothetical protein AVL59_43585 [Streptomyces griseochromogenes]MBP2053463.1 hypothetical protein [Streptomyces griseochromogenes]
MAASRRSVRRSLVDYAFATASLATLVMGIVFVNLDHSLTRRQILAWRGFVNRTTIRNRSRLPC